MQVNTNGVLSFNKTIRSINAPGYNCADGLSFPLNGVAMITPSWSDYDEDWLIPIDDYSIAGRLFYRFSTDETLLQEVGAAISSAFVSNFSPTSLFIATWEEMRKYWYIWETDENMYHDEVSQDMVVILI